MFKVDTAGQIKIVEVTESTNKSIVIRTGLVIGPPDTAILIKPKESSLTKRFEQKDTERSNKDSPSGSKTVKERYIQTEKHMTSH